MLGQLFQSLAPSLRKLSRPPLGNESSPQDVPLSVTEDAHTRSLLFPDPDILSRSQSDVFPLQETSVESTTAVSGAIFDNWNTEVGSDGARDIRVLVARDELGTLPKAILYDSVSPISAVAVTDGESTAATSGHTAGRGSAAPVRWRNGLGNSPGMLAGSATALPAVARGHGRSGSTSLTSLFTSPPTSPTVGSFGRTRLRGSSITSVPEKDIQRLKRDVKDAEEELNTYMDCMFGNTVSSYRGPSMKMHILPPRRSFATPASTPTFRKSPSTGEAPSMRQTIPRSTPRETSQTVVLVTRTFSLPLHAPSKRSGSTATADGSDINAHTTRSSNQSPDPVVPHLKQQRALFYAVALAIRMSGSSPSALTSPAQTERLRQRSTLEKGSHDFFSGWNTSPKEASTGLVDDFVAEVVTRHWDVISRTLYALQQDVQDKITLAYMSAPVGRPLDIAQGDAVRGSALKAIARVADAINTARVATGQGRWGIWRDEAHWVTRWAQSHRQDMFFVTLLTAYLANHREWLELIPEVRYRRLARLARLDPPSERLTLSSRTIILSNDKMTSRRLIFLLSSFLPTYRSYHPSMSPAASLKALTDASYFSKTSISRASPPSTVTDESQMRLSSSYDRRHGPRSPLAQGLSIASLIGHDATDTGKAASTRSRRTSAVTVSSTAPGFTVPVAHFAPRTTALKSPQAVPSMRRGSTDSLASANLLQNLQMARSYSQSDHHTTRYLQKLDSTGSEHAIDQRESPPESSPLARLQRSGTAATASILGSSAESGGKRLQNLLREDGVPALQAESPVSPFRRSRVSFGGRPFPSAFTGSQRMQSNAITRMPLASSMVPSESAERPQSSGLPFKMSVNEKDGIIDVDVPFADFGFTSPLASPSGNWQWQWPEQQFSTSWESRSQGLSQNNSQSQSDNPSRSQSQSHSPTFSYIHGTQGLYGNVHLPVPLAPSSSAHQPLRVAGWLRRFHPDWHVQAVRPYADFEPQFRAAMSAEMTPPVNPPPPPDDPTSSNADSPSSSDYRTKLHWTDVCSTLIVDPETFTIRRIRLRRLLRYTYSTMSADAPLSAGFVSGGDLNSSVPHNLTHQPVSSAIPWTSRSDSDNVVEMQGKTASHLRLVSTEQAGEEFFEDIISSTDADDLLLDALEAILGQKLRADTAPAAANSTRPSRRESTVFHKSGIAVASENSASRIIGHSKTASVASIKSEKAVQAIDSKASDTTSMTDNAAKRISTSADKSTKPITPITAEFPRPDVSRRECEHLLLGALEGVVREAAAHIKDDNAFTATGSLQEQVEVWLKEYEW